MIFKKFLDLNPIIWLKYDIWNFFRDCVKVALFQLGDVTLFLSVYNRRRSGMGRKGREMIGWLSLGLNSSGSEELQHWNDMRTARQPTQVQRWHSLLRP